MYFRLIKNDRQSILYGNIPMPVSNVDCDPAFYTFGWDDMMLMLDDFRGDVNDLCDTAFDLGDVDYITAEKCEDLIPWILERLGSLDGSIRGHYIKLLEFAKKAVELNTGVVVEL